MKDSFFRSDASAQSCAFRVAFVYAVIGFLWILLSDRAVNLLLGLTPAAAWAQTVKGWIFVSVTALLIFLLTRNTISSIKKSQDALRESQRVLTTLFDNLPGMAYRCSGDIECTLEFVSAGSMELTGYHPNELVAKKKIADLILQEDRDRVRTVTESALAEKETFRLVYRIQRSDGSIKWAWEQGRGIYSPSGQLVSIEGFITDITERKQAEEALTRSEEIYRALVESTSDAILMVDRKRTIISVNRAFLDLFGYTREEIEGHSVRIIHPSDESFEEFEERAYPALEAGPIRLEWELERKDGTIFPVEGTYSAIRGLDGSITGHVGIIRDITERKKVDREIKKYREHLEKMVQERSRELEEAQKALVQREKLKTLGAIAAEVAHEIRNPLVSIGGFARRLQKKYPGSREAEIILKESRRLENMLNRITHYLRPIEMKSKDCYVNSILSEALELLAPELEKEHVLVRLELDPDLPAAHVDPDILAQVFVAIIRSAVNVMDTDRNLKVSSYDGEQAVYIDFRGNTGKKAKDPELMLLPFDQEEQLGVSSSFKLLRGMGGNLSFSELDHEAVFTVSLIRCQNPQDSRPEHE